jgi:hypothetical protein
MNTAEATPAPTSIGLALLKQDVSHAARIKEYELAHKDDQLRIAKLEGVLRLAAQVLRDGKKVERSEVADRLDKILREPS